MFTTYSSSSSLVITSRWFAISHLVAPVSVRLVYCLIRGGQPQALKQDLNWPTLLQRRKIHDFTMLYKIHFGIVNISIPSVVLPFREIPKTDFAMSYILHPGSEHRSVACFGHTFYVRTIPLWNSFPVSPASAISLNCFQHLSATHCGSPQP